MTRRRIQEAALLILLAVLAGVGVMTLATPTPLRIVAGIALVILIPWLGASRLPPIRQSDIEGARLSGAGAIGLAVVILLGLLLSTSAEGITTGRITVGLLIIVAALAVIGVPAERPLVLPGGLGRKLLSLALTAAAIAISLFAFTIARDRALTQAHEKTAYAAFLVKDGEWLDLGLSNSTERAAQFTVRNASRNSGRETRMTVPAKSTRTVREFIANPPRLRPRQRLTPRSIQPVRIRVTVTVHGRRAGPVLALSTYAP